jgi:hypothetical protein
MESKASSERGITLPAVEMVPCLRQAARYRKHPAQEVDMSNQPTKGLRMARGGRTGNRTVSAVSSSSGRRSGTSAAEGAMDMSNMIRRLWVRLALTGGLVTAAAAAAAWHTDPILLKLAGNHCEPLVRDQ